MSPEIVRAKLFQLQKVLADLGPNVAASRQEQERTHYEIERQVQLAADFAVAIARRVLVLRGVVLPDSSRRVIIELGEEGVIDRDLAARIATAVGLRNLLVHEYGEIDYDLFFDGLADGHRAFVRFCDEVHRYLQGSR